MNSKGSALIYTRVHTRYNIYQAKSFYVQFSEAESPCRARIPILVPIFKYVYFNPIIIMPLRLLAIQSEVVSFPSHIPNQPKKMLKRACALLCIT
ncbi:hypothetical protein EYC80_003282 [Monilinia laxa]|uniref:Uncharacterized protein n=1 Tax=Monilinia laxa TaxID=61186 RepID=A0A5N6KD79_MONLA|nr:hypothetical protein EYC80_003282 [Monilinia laxa]